MKKLLILSSILMCLTVSAQTGTTTDARNYVNANITTNGANSITGAKMNTALNKIINAIDTGQWRLQSGYLQPKDTTKQIRIPQLKSAAPACVGDFIGIGNSVAYLDIASMIMEPGTHFCDASIMQNVNRLLAIDDIFFTPDTTIVCSPPAPYEVSVVFALPNLCAGAYIEGIELRTKGTFNSVNNPELGTSLMVDNVPIYYNGQTIWADAQDNGTLDYTITDNTHRTSISSVVGTFFWASGFEFSIDGLQVTYHIRSDAGHVVLTTDASGIIKFDTINMPTLTNDLDSLGNLKDVQLSYPYNGQILTYDNDRWVNQNLQMTEAPTDGKIYGRQNGNWASVNSGILDAPYDGNYYVRQNGNWAQQQSQTLYSTNGITGDGSQSNPFKLGGALIGSASIDGYNHPIAFNNMFSFSVNSTGNDAYSTIVNNYSDIVMLSMRPSGHILSGQSSQQNIRPEGITLQHFYQSSPGMGSGASSITLTDDEATLYGRSTGISFQDNKAHLFLNQESDSIDFVLGKKIGSSEIVWTPRTSTAATVLGENSGITTSYTTYLIDFTGFSSGTSDNYLPALSSINNGTTFKIRRVDNNSTYNVNITTPDLNSIQDFDNFFTNGIAIGGSSTVRYVELTAFKNGINGYSGTNKWVVIFKY